MWNCKYKPAVKLLADFPPGGVGAPNPTFFKGQLYKNADYKIWYTEKHEQNILIIH